MIKKYKDGGVYEGEGTFLTKKREGKGEMRYANGDVYNGDWKDDVRCGNGRFKALKERYEYNGEWENDTFHGKGTLTKSNGQSYTGCFVNGKYEGNGTLKLSGGGRYVGNFENDQYHGRGRLYDRSNKLVYEGEYKNGFKSGHGTEHTELYTYTGSFLNGKFHGSGRLNYKNGDWIFGTFSQGKPVGVSKCQLTDKNGNVYTGTISDEQYSGEGTLTMKNGIVYQGIFAAGKKNGTFTVTQPDGSAQTVQYKNDKKVTEKASAEKDTATKKKTNKKSDTAKAEEKPKEEKKPTSRKKSAEQAESAKKPEDTAKKTTRSRKPTFSSPEFELLYTQCQEAVTKARASASKARAVQSECKRNRLSKESSLRYKSMELIRMADNQFEHYRGEKRFDKFHGYGIYSFADHSTYEGEWKEGKRTGKGIFIYSSKTEWSKDKYEGEFVDGSRNGKGVYTHATGEVIEGEFKDGQPSGYAVYTWTNGKIYEGRFIDGEISGMGILTTKEKEKYIGQFEKGKLQGKGIYIKSTTQYEGDFVDSKFNGKGIYHYKDLLYVGDFKDDAFNGKGRVTWPDGTTYEGDLADSKRNGTGILIRPNGERFEGEWKDSELVKGMHYSAAGELLETIPPEEETPKPNESEAKKQQTDTAPKTETAPMFMPEPADSGITFADVAGLEEVKDEIRYHVLEPLRDPSVAATFGVTPGGKLLLYGPPGTGKTLIARAIAGEVKAAFYSISCQDLISKWLGESSERLNRLFDEAQQNERAIIFFDEFDSVASKRDGGGNGASGEMARFVATFLTKVDGFKQRDKDKMLLLIAATNRPWALDSAMLRGGRFDTQIYVGMPDQPAREFLVNRALSALPLDETVDLKQLAADLEGYGGGDIVAACDKIRLAAYRQSVRQGKTHRITREDCDTVLQGMHNHVSAEEMARFEAYKNGHNAT